MTHERTKALLRKLRDQLEFYGDQHTAKAPPQAEKARANYELVQEINVELLTIAEEENVRDPDKLPGGVDVG